MLWTVIGCYPGRRQSMQQIAVTFISNLWSWCVALWMTCWSKWSQWNWHIHQYAECTVAQLYAVHTGKETCQMSADVHPQECTGIWAGWIMDLEQLSWFLWAVHTAHASVMCLMYALIPAQYAYWCAWYWHLLIPRYFIPFHWEGHWELHHRGLVHFWQWGYDSKHGMGCSNFGMSLIFSSPASNDDVCKATEQEFILDCGLEVYLIVWCNVNVVDGNAEWNLRSCEWTIAGQYWMVTS